MAGPAGQEKFPKTAWARKHFLRRLLPPFPVPWLASMFVLLADVTALSCVGMRRALTARSHNHATISTVFRVLLTPWALLGVVVVIGTTWYVLLLGGEWSPGWN